MKNGLIAAAVIFPALFAGCQKKQPESVPVPKAAPQAVAVSSVPVVDQNPLTAPGTYLKTTVGHIKEAKDAKALYEATEKKNLDSLDLNNTGGN